jgi:putative membrane protein
MKTGRLASIAMITLVAIFGYNNTVLAKASKNTTKIAKPVKDTNVNDRETIAFLEIIDKAEIDAAKDVKNRLHNKNVKKYAEHMIKDHSANLKKTKKISKDEKISALETDGLRKQKKDNKAEVAHLKKLKGAVLDKEYIDAMVSGHQKALKAVEDMEPKVKNAVLKAHLANTKKTVAEHLEMAKSLQKALAAKK